MRVLPRAVASFALAIAFAGVGPAAAEDAAKPLPFDHTVILPSGGTYYVEGRVRIAKGTELTIQKETKVVGRGAEAGVIEVEGELEVHGVKDGITTLEDVTIELLPKFGNVHTDMTVFKGKRTKGIVSSHDLAVDGRLFVENTDFEGPATVDVTMVSNNVDLQRCTFNNKVHVKGVDAPGATSNRVRLMVMNNASGSQRGGAFYAGLNVEHVGDVTVRTNVLQGDKVTFKDCASVTFDANYVKCASLEFLQLAAGRFGKTSMSKCDVQCDHIVLSAPADPKKPESMPCDKCWFGGETKEKIIREKFFKDHDDDPACGVTVDIQKVMEKPLQLAGTVTK
jgi:hypothetical protein